MNYIKLMSLTIFIAFCGCQKESTSANEFKKILLKPGVQIEKENMLIASITEDSWDSIKVFGVKVKNLENDKEYKIVEVRVMEKIPDLSNYSVSTKTNSSLLDYNDLEKVSDLLVKIIDVEKNKKSDKDYNLSYTTQDAFYLGFSKEGQKISRMLLVGYPDRVGFLFKSINSLQEFKNIINKCQLFLNNQGKT